MDKTMATKIDDLIKQKEQLEIQVAIAESRAAIMEANVRRLKSQAEFTTLRAAIAQP